LLNIKREIYKIELQNRFTIFRSIVVKLYYKETEKTEQSKKKLEEQQDQDQELQKQDRDKKRDQEPEQLVQRNSE
jgi:hypothetical protein